MKLTAEVEKWVTLTTGTEVAALVTSVTVELWGLTKTFTVEELTRKAK